MRYEWMALVAGLVLSLRALGIESAETIGDFYIRDGKIAAIVARFTPNTAAAVRAAMP